MAAVLKKLNDHTQEFKQALTRLTLRNDAMFFVALLYSMRHERHDPFVVRGQRAPAATDGVRICYDGELFGKYSLEDRMFILVHEILHVVLYHALRLGARDPNLWNIACDYVVNGMIADHKQGNTGFATPKDAIQPDPAFKGLSAEQVYDLLLQEAKDALAGGKKQGKGKNGRNWVRAPGNAEGGGRGIQLDGHEPNDVMEYDPSTNEGKAASQVEREVGMETEKAIQSAKAAGQGSHLMTQLLREAQVQHEPWYAHLRRFMTAVNEGEYNWARLNRRRMALHNLIAPDIRVEKMGKIVISIDESGSLTDEVLSAIAAHTCAILRECNPKQVVVLRHTDCVTDEEVHDGPDYNFPLVRKSTGGTDFRPVFDRVEAEHGDAQVLIMFTDMYGPFPELPPHMETLWVTSTPEQTVKTPFGERIQADFND